MIRCSTLTDNKAISVETLNGSSPTSPQQFRHRPRHNHETRMHLQCSTQCHDNRSVHHLAIGGSETRALVHCFAPAVPRASQLHQLEPQAECLQLLCQVSILAPQLPPQLYHLTDMVDSTVGALYAGRRACDRF